MGGGGSKHRRSHRSSYDYGHSSSGYTPRYSSSSANYVQPETVNRLQRKYSRINDDYQTLNQVCYSMQLFQCSSRKCKLAVFF